MRGWLGLLISSMALLMPVPGAAADPARLEGVWNVLIIHPSGGCTWTGQVTFGQNADTLEGEGWAVAQQDAVQKCAPLLEGNVAGVIDGRVVRLGFGTGALGIADFRGVILKGDSDMTGLWTTGSVNGDWTASRAQQ